MENGKKVGIMELTKRFWDSMGYLQLSKTSQNLADKYRHLQKTANIPSLLFQANNQGKMRQCPQQITTLLILMNLK